ncbi:MAG: phosphoribosylanthranilate isomerase [Candidatus Omnitrophica bacterium]|nr:phosphoribosylanthranilate isomerase [Candidatus Omnitrophota bacterium]MCF7877695.1 phosphoribosylanthranilate isomerase [Candidatus Omnitrophota bacterium]MCF7878695.1 phosphoribosylanthranilate isomerase [Candidatus Omnitrophota bacterium]MCF7892958.1 phosphoribosylanthranilate isomerase [Candidatus Omnitrophota bacterium]
MVRVKICGITNLEDALLAEKFGADAVGFIFTQKSPRYIKPVSAKKIVSSLGPFISKVGVFMNQKKEKVLEIASYLGLDTLQFHGKESLSYCSFFKPRFKVIKVCFPGGSAESIGRYQKLDAVMFDIPYHQKNKKKKTLPVNFFQFIKKEIKAGKRIILSGGLNPDNVGNIVKFSPYGVDLASGVEELVGKKDKKAMKKFIKRVKNASS